MTIIKNLLILSILTVFFITAPAQQSVGISAPGKKLVQYSDIYKEDRELLLYLPQSFNDTHTIRQHIPVLYLLDGDDYFMDAVVLQRRLAEYAMYKSIPEMIIVGVVHKNREEELFTKPANTQNSPIKGGADQLHIYLEKEVIPYIDSMRGGKGPTILYGHSLGGLFGLYVLQSNAALFDAYLISDPALWWDNSRLFNQLKQSLVKINDKKLFLYLGISNTLPYKNDTNSIKKLNPSKVSITSQFGLKNYLDHHTFPSIRSEVYYYNDETHFSLPLTALHDGLLNYYKDYRCQYFEWMDDPELSEIQLVKEIKIHYENLSSLLGYRIIPTKPELNKHEAFLDRLGLRAKSKQIRLLTEYYYQTGK